MLNILIILKCYQDPCQHHPKLLLYESSTSQLLLNKDGQTQWVNVGLACGPAAPPRVLVRTLSSRGVSFKSRAELINHL